MHPSASSILPEPVLLNKYQDFSDLPPMLIRKGVDDEGNPWTPDILIAAPHTVDTRDPSAWAQRQFGGAAFHRDFSGAPGILDTLPAQGDPAWWVLRIENQKPRRKLLTLRLFAAPAGQEDDALAWTPVDKFLWEVEAKAQAAVARRVRLDTLLDTWARRSLFQSIGMPADAQAAAAKPVWVFVAALATDAEIDHPENVCHCGSVQACSATAEGLDRRDPRYPFNRVFKHSIRTTFPLLGPSGMRMLRLG